MTVTHRAQGASLDLEISGAAGTLRAEQFLPVARDRLFPFFADARNLARITPPWLGFRILTPTPIPMVEGRIIDYRISLRGIPLRWRTRIDVWDPPFAFVDEQVKGPYRLWRHRHEFEEMDGGTLCIDLVEYRIFPGGLPGALVNRHLVSRDVRRIFAYRRDELARLFGEKGGNGSHRD